MSTDLKHFKIIKVFFHSTLLGLDVKNAFFDQNELVYDEKCISVNINMNLLRHRRMSKCCLRVTNSFIEFHVLIVRECSKSGKGVHKKDLPVQKQSRGR